MKYKVIDNLISDKDDFKNLQNFIIDADSVMTFNKDINYIKV